MDDQTARFINENLCRLAEAAERQASALERLAASVDTANAYGETGSAAIAGAILRGLRK